MFEMDSSELQEFYDQHETQFNDEQADAVEYLLEREEDIFAYLEDQEDKFSLKAGKELEDSQIAHLYLEGTLQEDYEVSNESGR